jgi:hypothetical protein
MASFLKSALAKKGLNPTAVMSAAKEKGKEVAKEQALAAADKAKASATAKAGDLAAAAKGKAAGAAAELKSKAEQEAAAAALGITDPAKKSQLGVLMKAQGGLSSVTSSMSTFFKVTLPALFSTIWTWMAAVANHRAFLPIVFSIALIIGAYFWFRYQDKQSANAKQALDNEKKALALSASTTGTAKKEGFQATPTVEAPAVPKNERLLVNTQPLTIKQAGFMGLTPEGTAKMDPQQATADALKAGFRSFVLQIDYLDVKKGKGEFAEPGYPTLVFKDNKGALITSNSGSIKGVAETIAAMAFRPEVPHYNMPVVLYLHVVRAPSPVRDMELYMRYLSKIASELAPLWQFHLGMTPSGGFNRQKQEDTLLNMPVQSLEGQVVILSNADTSLFRSPELQKEGMKYNPKEDLDFWVNMRVYLDSDDTTIGISKTAEKTPSAVVVKLEDVIGLSAAKRDAFATKGKNRFVIAMPNQDTNPSLAELDKAILELGINMVPLDIFTPAVEDTKRMLETYENDAYRTKPSTLRRMVA